MKLWRRLLRMLRRKTGEIEAPAPDKRRRGGGLHICGVCGQEFDDEAGYASHKCPYRDYMTPANPAFHRR